VARGFDSKSVEGQQDEAEREKERPAAGPVPVSPRRKSLELARVDMLRRLEGAPEARRAELQTALAALDELIAKS
jgi:hypothetical protein